MPRFLKYTATSDNILNYSDSIKEGKAWATRPDVCSCSPAAGRCGACQFAPVGGGSHARAFALTGNPEDPWCSYQPGPSPYPADLAATGLRPAA
jgi:MoaA/NifB/PqqE/SkfB family radical SAM enzyme